MPSLRNGHVMSIAVSTAISGMRTAALRLEASARHVAGAGATTTEASTSAGDADLAAEALEQASARASFMASAATLRITQDMVKRLFEVAD
jgi:hypothetical protein